MSMQGLSWALELRCRNTAARLVAIRIGDFASAEGVYTLNVDDLMDWCCLTSDELQAALDYLVSVVGITMRALDDGEPVLVILPYHYAERERPKPIERQITIYVAVSDIGTKVGITAGTVEGRMRDLSFATVRPVTAVWSKRGAATMIRKAEQHTKERLAAHKIAGEWFSITPDEAKAVILDVLSILEPK